MSFRCEHIFTGLIDGKNITKVRLDYSVNGVQDRIYEVEQILKEYDNFLVKYFDDYFLTSVSKYDELSLNNNICLKIENIADYILNQVPREQKLEYKFYSDYRDFEKEINKELNLEKVANKSDGDNVIHFLIQSGQNYKKTKEIIITPKDYNRQDYLGEILNQYKDYLEYLKELKKIGTTREKYYCNKNMSLVNSDMLYCKQQLDGIFGINLRNPLSSSEKPNFDDIDFTNLHHIECMLKSSKSSLDFDNDYSMQLNYFKKLYKNIYNKLNYKEKKICEILSWGNSSVTQVNDILKIGYESNNIKELYIIDSLELKRIIHKVCKLIADEHLKDLERFLKINYNNGRYKRLVKTKVCSKCNEEKPLSSFWKRELSKDGTMNICKECYKG